MGISRRQFLYSAGTAVASLSTLAPHAARASSSPALFYPPHDLSPFAVPLATEPAEIRVGYAAMPWGDDLAQAMLDISAVGYRGVQLRANAPKLYPDPHALRNALSQEKLLLAALSSGDVNLDPAQRDANIAMHEEHAKYVAAAGCTMLQVIGTFHKDGNFTAEDYRREGQILTEIGKRAAHHGVRVGLHNHMGGIAQSPEQFARVLDAADPTYVKVLLDVAHYRQGGGDPAEAVRKYADRLLFVHFKDVEAAGTPTGYQFVELGRGKVDLPAVVAALRSIHYRGWAIVELDREPEASHRTPKESAEMSKSYLESTLGIRV